MKNFIDQKVNIKVIIASLWAAVMFIYIYADIKTFFQTGFIEQLMTGEVVGITITQGFLLGAAVLMSIPPVMIVLSLILKPGANRILNIVVTLLHIALIIALQFIPADVWLYYIFYNILEVVFHALILWYAWKWPVKEV